MEMGNTKAAGRLRVSVSMVITKLRKSSRAGKNRVPFIILFLLLMGVGIAQAGTDLKYSVSWIGNSFSGKHQWVLQDVADLYVDSDGALFTNVIWDEAGGNVQQYRDGKQGATTFHTHGWGYEGARS